MIVKLLDNSRNALVERYLVEAAHEHMGAFVRFTQSGT
jgi:hypothetical protein